MKRFFALIGLLLFAAAGLSGQKTVFEPVKIRRHRGAQDRVLVDKFGALTFDDSTRQLTFKSDAGDLIEVGYCDVRTVVFDSATHMRGGVPAALVQAIPLAGPIAGGAMAGSHVDDYWFFLGYRDHDCDESALLVIPKNSSERVIAKATGAFGSLVTVTNFPENQTGPGNHHGGSVPRWLRATRAEAISSNCMPTIALSPSTGWELTASPISIPESTVSFLRRRTPTASKWNSKPATNTSSCRMRSRELSKARPGYREIAVRL